MKKESLVCSRLQLNTTEYFDPVIGIYHAIETYVGKY